MFNLDPRSLMFATGVLYVAMPITVWSLLFKRHPRPNLELWCLSGLAFSVALILLGLRGLIPEFVSIVVANVVGYLSLALKAAVLRMENGRPSGWPWLAGFLLLALVAQVLALYWLDPVSRSVDTFFFYAVCALALAWTARELAQSWGSRSAALMSWLYAAFGIACLVRCLRLALGWSDGRPQSPELDFVAMVAFAFVATVVANVGFMGVALDRARAGARDQQRTMDQLRDQQRALENAARTREAVAGERARTTRLLAHEVRQPLHNAAVALQSAISTLERSRDSADAAHAIEQAQSVIRRIGATLDNTVAAATMLAADGRISTASTDLQMLIDLCLGDLSPSARARVQLAYQADARSAQLEASLVRLALRNLLTNATLYAPGDTPVMLRVLDSDEPLALVLEVADLGPGIEPQLRELIFEEGVRGASPTVPGYGLGLHVVRRVAMLHGGAIEWRPNKPQGSVFRLTLPQGDPG